MNNNYYVAVIYCFTVVVSTARMLRFAVLLFTLLVFSEARIFLGRLSELQHDVRGNVYAISCRELTIENFYYDGLGPAVYAFVGDNPANRPSGRSVGADATVVYNGRRFTQFPPPNPVVQRHANTTLSIILPDSYELDRIRWLSIWCRRFRANFGHITFASGNQVVQDVCSRKVFCQELREGYDVCWRANSTGGYVQVTLCSNLVGRNQYMGFGISKTNNTVMVNSDPALCWRDNNDNWTIQDYYISAYAQCAKIEDTILGVCMDTRYSGGVDNLAMTRGQEEDGVACCTYTRPLSSSNFKHDNDITLTGPQAVVYAIGSVNQGIVLQHPDGFRPVSNVFVDFANGSNADVCYPDVCNKFPTEECCKDRYRSDGPTTSPSPSTPPPECKPCSKRRGKIEKKKRRHFVFTIGVTQGRCGYERLTNSSGGWGIAWYVDGCLIPHLTVRRGKTYTFCVFGGNNSSLPSQYHPLYFTSSPVGGYLQSSMNETIYAGIDENDNPLFTGPLVQHPDVDVKRCCTKKRQICPRGARRFKWKPTKDTPDELYYQCATHFFLGWKISVKG